METLALLFMAALTLRMGYRDGRMIGAALATGLGIVLLFRTFLQVRLPGGQLYHHLPDGLSIVSYDSMSMFPFLPP